MDEFIGIIKIFAGNFAPRGWALCQGQILSIAQNTALFSILGTTYGGNGQTTFALPDLRGRFPNGQGQGPGLSSYSLGQQGGTESGTLNAGNLPAHQHTVACSNGDATTSKPGGNVNAIPAGGGAAYGAPTVEPATMNAAMIQGPTGGPQPFSHLNPYLTINYIICLEGIFPSRN